MSKQTKQQLREASILYSARDIARESGLVQLRMPEVAKQAQVSVGSLYRHYENREDLITALAQQALLFRTDKLSNYCAAIQDPHERINALICLDFLFNVAHPEAFHCELTCDNPQWWKAVSPQLQEDYQRCAVQIAAAVQKTVRSAVSADTSNQIISQTATGIWSLVTGISNIWLVQHQNETPDLPAALEFLTPHLQAFCRGYCPEALLPDQQLQALFSQLIADQQQWLWPHLPTEQHTG